MVRVSAHLRPALTARSSVVVGQAGAVEPPADRAVLVLVTGLQGTGKSTVAGGVADALAAPVFAWDWFMAALTPFESLQAALERMDAPAYRSVGWSMLRQAARAQLRRGLAVVLDGMARDDEIAAVRALGDELSVPTLVVLTTCEDPAVRRSRIEGRDRAIPGWYELTWEDVERSRARWVPPDDVDLVLDTMDPPEASIRAVVDRLAR
jgi:predicted kinase